jgi:PPP family 3-phenylpropionic acid transporter
VTVLAALALPELPRSPEELLPSERSEPAEDRLSVVRRLAGRSDFLVFLAAVGAVQGAHALFYAFGALHWRSLGISGTWVGLLWTIGVLAEVAVFAYSRAILARIGAVELMIAGGAAATLRWAAMSIDPPIAVLVPLQLLHALSYGAAHLGAIHFIATTVPQQAAGTGQALYATIAAGVAMGAATLAAGPLYAHYAGQAYLAMAALALAGTMAAVVLWRLARSAVPPTERS